MARESSVISVCRAEFTREQGIYFSIDAENIA
jgi:hypothetical protein